jgi:CHAD domain-containing protein
VTKPSSERLGPLVERVRAQAAEFIARDADVRAEIGEGIHQMRVATRRLRSCFRTFRGAFEPVATNHLGGELAWISDLLGRARDAQVIAGRLSGEFGTSVDAEISDGGDERAALLKAMGSRRYQALVVEIATFAISPPLARDAKGRQWMVRRLRREVERAVDRVTRADSLSGPERDRALHETRKAAKRVRYAAETLETLYGKRARRIAKVFEEVQVVLGEHHDAIVLQELLEGLDTTELAPLIAVERARAAGAEVRFAETWARVVKVVRHHWPAS